MTVLKMAPREDTVPEPPPDLGRLMTAEEVVAKCFNDTVTVSWVKKHLKAGRVRLGHSTVRWYEKPVRAWITEQLEAAS